MRGQLASPDTESLSQLHLEEDPPLQRDTTQIGEPAKTPVQPLRYVDMMTYRESHAEAGCQVLFEAVLARASRAL
jgi:hypothetical protein